MDNRVLKIYVSPWHNSRRLCYFLFTWQMTFIILIFSSFFIVKIFIQSVWFNVSESPQKRFAHFLLLCPHFCDLNRRLILHCLLCNRLLGLLNFDVLGFFIVSIFKSCERWLLNRPKSCVLFIYERRIRWTSKPILISINNLELFRVSRSSRWIRLNHLAYRR